MEIVKDTDTVKTLHEQAEKEVAEEKAKAAKEKIKVKLKDLDKAKLVVRNIERELEDLMIEISSKERIFYARF